MFDLMIIAAPRDKPYLSGTVDEIRSQFDVVPHVFAEPGTQPVNHVHWHQNYFRCGMVGNWFYNARYMLETSNKPFIACCEDDIQLQPECGYRLRLLLMRAVHDPRIGFISPYCSKVNAYQRHIHLDDWVDARVGSQGWCGSLFMVFPRKVLEYIVSDWFRFKEHAMINYHKPHHLDYAIGKTVLDANYKIVTHHPTLVIHTGDISTHPPNNTDRGKSSDARKPAL